MNKIFLICFLLIAFSCNRKPSFSVIPKITYKSISSNLIKAGSSEQATRISLIVEDGDGDIGYETENLFFKDSRDSSIIKMRIPVIPSEYAPNKGVKGTITVDYLAAWLTLRPDTNHIEFDTLRWEIYMQDKAGNISNTIVTEDIYLFK
ncbi:MAG TPA: hypothetical protein PLU17_06670 [Chitinophagaceae bacterium]|jgi:hypothetical protein|nr:hypothetical protein [Chitinophagaceae bacterium]